MGKKSTKADKINWLYKELGLDKDVKPIPEMKKEDMLKRIATGTGSSLDSQMVGLKPKIEGDPADTLGTYGEQAFDRVKAGTGDMADSVKTFGSAIYQNIQEENKRKARTPEVLDGQIKQLEDLLLDYQESSEEYKALSRKIIELKIEKITRMNNKSKKKKKLDL